MTFTQVLTANSQTKTSGVVRTRILRTAGQPIYLTVRGSQTGGAGVIVRAFNADTMAWTSVGTYDPTNVYSPVKVVPETDLSTTFVELDLYLPAGSTLTLTKMALGTVDWSVAAGIVRRNLATNPSFETTTGTVNVRTNLYTNPSFESLAAAVATRTNLCTNPSSETMALGTAGAGSGTATLDNTLAYVGTQSTKYVWTSGGWGFKTNPATITVSASTTYALSLYCYVQSGAMPSFIACDAAYTNASNFTVQPTSTGSWQRCTLIYTTGASQTTLMLYSQVTAASTFNVDAILIEQMPVVLPYFDGSTAAGNDFTYGWSGAAHASTSVQQAPPPNGGNARNGVYSVGSTVWKGSRGYSVRLVPNAATNDSNLAIGGDTGGFRLGMQPGKTYTVSGVCHLEAAQTGTLNNSARKIKFFYKDSNGIYQSIESNQLPNTAGATQRLSVTAAVPSTATEIFVRLYNGASAGGGDVWWDDVVVEENVTDGSYFDGSNPARVRTNLCTNPSLEANTSNWGSYAGSGGAGTQTRVAGGYLGSWFIRHQWTTGTSNVAGIYYGKHFGISPGSVYSVAMWVRSTRNVTVALNAEWYDVNNSGLPGAAGTPVTLQTGVWTRLVLNGVTAPAGAVSGTFTVYSRAGVTWNAGDQLDGDACILEQAATVGDFFDGSTAAAGGLGYAWTGAANSSVSYQYDLDYTYAWGGSADSAVSYQQAPGIASAYGPSADRAMVHSSSKWWAGSRSRAMRVTPRGVGNNASYGCVNFYAQAGVTYTISGTVWLPATLTGSFHSTLGLGIWPVFSDGAYTVVKRGVNAPGAYRAVSTVTVPTSQSIEIRLMNGATGGNGDVWWDDILVEANGSVDALYFDGQTEDQSAYSTYYWWEGQADASTSVLTSQPRPAFPNGNGIGAVAFSGDIQGSLKAPRWIGLSVNLKELESGEGTVRLG